MGRALLVVSAVSAAALAGHASAQGSGGVQNNQHLRFTQAHGHTFSEVGDPGNPAFLYQQIPGAPIRPMGAVDYTYRIATQEVQGRHWIDFVNAYAPYIGGDYFLPSYSGITQFAGFQNGVPYYILPPGNENLATATNMRHMVRYCNWLHNGAPTGPNVPQWVFESGAYDTSTFGHDGGITDQEHRSPGARFFLPSLDEWIKGVYWDPNRNGEGEGGYWRYPDAGDDPLVMGHPDNGGETNAGSFGVPGIPHESGSYPNSASPWGLLDASGGLHEMVEDYFYFPGGSRGGRTRVGSSIDGLEFFDLIGRHGNAPVTLATGFRIAMIVPSPGASAAVLLGGVLLTRRRRL